MPKNKIKNKIIILGTGPCGLGAAWRLEELQHKDFKIFEKLNHAGGLATSFTDEKGFTWDIGGHVQFSHYQYFDEALDYLLKDEWIYHDRESWIWIDKRFVPYPFQNNIRHLAKDDMWKCLKGIIDLYSKPRKKPGNFKEWIILTFGQGIAEIFLLPYNFKIWAYPAEKLAYDWVGDRVSVPDLNRVIENIVFEKDDISWGPNNQFRFPMKGGTGAVWKKLGEKIAHKIAFNHEAIEVNSSEKYVKFKNGHVEHYDYLISTIPLDKLILMLDLDDKPSTQDLLHSSVHIFGIGLKGNPQKHLGKKCWMYFPEDDCPFYRATIFSNYSPYNVPDINKYWSLMVEVSESQYKKVDSSTIKEEVIQGLLNTNLIESKDAIVDFWHHFEAYGYPTPSLHRDKALEILSTLNELGIFSRGRFGAWIYEVSNQDHTFMQGVEAVDKIILNKDEVTVWHPEIVNNSRTTFKQGKQ